MIHRPIELKKKKRHNIGFYLSNIKDHNVRLYQQGPKKKFSRSAIFDPILVLIRISGIVKICSYLSNTHFLHSSFLTRPEISHPVDFGEIRIALIGSQSEAILIHRGPLTMFEDIFGCHNWRSVLLKPSEYKPAMMLNIL